MSSSTVVKRSVAKTLDARTTPLVKRQFIEASAGTGKTWTITAIVVRLLLERELDIRQLLVVTFTNAATAELRERIWMRLLEVRQALLQNTEPSDPFLAEIYQQFPLGDARENALKRLENARRGFDEAAVYTIHGFCQRVLAESENATGLEEASLEPDDHDLLTAIIREVWIAEYQHLSVADTKLLAGLKPSVILDDCRLRLLKPYLHLFESASASNEEYNDFFTQVAANWAQARAVVTEALLAGNLNKTSYGKVGLWLEALDEWLNGEPSVAPTALSANLEKLNNEQLTAKTNKGKAPPTHAFFDVLQTLLAQGKLFSNGVAQQFRRRVGDIALERLMMRKDRLGRRSFQDMLDSLGRILQSESGALVASRIREQLPVALIDEFQDTDPTQLAIFNAIYPASEDAATLFLVGDPKQAIYSFRGADIHTYLSARESASEEWGLTVNRRSQQPLIDGLAALFDVQNPFLLSDLSYPKVSAADNGDGVCFNDDRGALHLLALSDEEDGFTTQEKELIGKGDANNRAAIATAEEIARLLRESLAGNVHFKGKPLRPGDIAVLVPTHRQGGLVADELNKLAIPAVRQSQESVWNSRDAQELLVILTALADPVRTGNISAALLTRLIGLSPLDVLLEQQDELSSARRLEQFLRLRERWRLHGFIPMWAELARHFELTKRLAATEQGERALTNLRHLVELMQAKSITVPSFEAQLEWFSEQLKNPEGNREEHQLRLESDAERVQIVTVHVSKGLQYPVVFCPFVWDGQLFKKSQDARAEFFDEKPYLDLGSPDFDEHIERAKHERLAEQLRLLYVALTRAQYRCYVAWGTIKDYQTAGLTWLLGGGGSDISSFSKTCSEQNWVETLNALQRNSANAFKWSYLSDYAATAMLSDRITSIKLQKPEIERVVHLNWMVGSFTGLSQHEVEYQEVPDHDGMTSSVLSELLLSEPQAELLLAEFPAGARTGICWHAIFEETPFEGIAEAALRKLVSDKLTHYGFDAETWTDRVQQHFHSVMQTVLQSNHGCVQLAGLQEYRVEMEFLYPVAQLTPSRLLSAVAHEDIPALYKTALARLDFRQLSGYLKGFIDLTFCADGRYYVLDYKSNRLNGANAYHPEKLPEAIAEHHYYLQYWLYTLALHRHLQTQLPDYDYDQHMGGVFYLFLRGMQPDTQQGVYFNKPPRGLIEALDQLFRGVV